MQKHAAFRSFVQEHESDLLLSALLLTEDRRAAERLVVRAFRTVGLTWPAPHWTDVATQARFGLYRAYLRRSSASWHRLLIVACLHDGTSPEPVARLIGISAADADLHLAVATRPALPESEIAAPRLADRAVRATRLGRVRRFFRPRRLVAAAVVFLLVQSVAPHLFSSDFRAVLRVDDEDRLWMTIDGEGSVSHNTTSHGAYDITVRPSHEDPTKPWQAPGSQKQIYYAVPAECRESIDLSDPEAPKPQPGTVLCYGWTLVMDTKPTSATDMCPGHPECTQKVEIPDAVHRILVGIEPGGHSYGTRDAKVAISRDGRRVAYLSGVERRFVAVDLRTGSKVYLSPVLSPAQMAESHLLAVSTDGRYFTVRGTRTDVGTGASGPALAGSVPEWSSSSPDNKLNAVVDQEASKNGTLHIRDAKTGKTLRSFPLPSLGGVTTSDVASWFDEDELIIRMSAGWEHVGWFRVNAGTGELLRVPGVPGDDKIVIGAADLWQMGP
ncbi:MAG: hypothetical protein HOV86_19095 [Thermoactinospora sp.]|nr:hypothetical protein [Thermoactinospora sp.]